MKKNLFVKSIVEKLARLDKSWNKDAILNLLKKLQNISAETMMKEDKILHENILDYLLKNKNCRTFIHYTKGDSTAQKIIEEGFRFAVSFHKTAEAISTDQIDLIYKHNLHKYFGSYIIVICISRDIYQYYENELNQIDQADFNVEQILTESMPELDENMDEVYTLPKQYVKGYLNYESGEIINNPDYNPDYDSQAFRRNLQKAKDDHKS
ncbi:MAG TPA: hypothetical protein VJ346_04705 [Bacteroidales bacterium]|nr:hypothetical protein [Bacteroidales bacterium]